MFRFAFAMFCAASVSTAAVAAPCAGFTDVDDSNAFCVNVEWMKNRGITLGLTPTLFGPDAAVTRLQMAAFMYRLGFQNALLRGGNSFGAPAILGTTDGHVVEVIASNARVMRYEPNGISPNVIGGSYANFVDAGIRGATIAGGGTPPGSEPFHDGEAPNRVAFDYGTVAGGYGNVAGSGSSAPFFASVGGGRFNIAAASSSTVAGGESNQAIGFGAAVAGGTGNLANGQSSAILGGYSNAASGTGSVVAGGGNNTAAGAYSFAAGLAAKANWNGCFVFADYSNPFATSCFANNEIVMRGLGGFYFWTSGSSDNTYTGASLAPGSGAWAAYSDRDGKQAINAVDPTSVLEKLVAMPIATWQWKAEPGNVLHMGPTAQDFRAAFGLGNSNKKIVTVDADGVALAAIQGLNAKLESVRAEKDAEIVALRAGLAEVRAVLDAMRR